MADEFSGIESAVRSIWLDVLGRSDVTSSDNFFRIGGDLALGQRLCDEIRRKFGYAISLPELCDAPTVGALSIIIRGNTTGHAGETLVCLQAGLPAHPVLYCFPPVAGSPARYSELLDHLAPEQPIYGVQAVGLRPGSAPDRSVDDAARRYCLDIMVHQNQRRSIFLGYSFGGMLVVETARELIACGCIRPIIAIIDCEPEISEIRDEVVFGFRSVYETVLQLSMDVEPLLRMARADALLAIRDAAVQQGKLPANFDLDRLRCIADVCEVSQRAANAYRPRWLGGEITVFESTEGTAVDVGRRWSKYFDLVDIRPLDFDHLAVMEGAGLAPIARWLAEQAATAKNSGGGIA